MGVLSGMHQFEMKPSEYLRRQLWATFQDDPVGPATYKFFGDDKYMWASDFPHTDSTWPNSLRGDQDGLRRRAGGRGTRKIVCDNAVDALRHRSELSARNLASVDLRFFRVRRFWPPLPPPSTGRRGGVTSPIHFERRQYGLHLHRQSRKPFAKRSATSLRTICPRIAAGPGRHSRAHRLTANS